MYVTATEYSSTGYLKPLHKEGKVLQDGFKLHISINDCGEILGFCLTPGNKDDRNREVMEHLTKNIFGKLFADKGYISQKLASQLLEKGIQLVTKQKKNAKKKRMRA